MSPLLMTLWLLAALRGGDTARDDPNVALGRPYALDPAPNYPLTSDVGDVTDLTDGKRAGPGFWLHKAAVGWRGVRPASITIDLGEPKTVTGATASMAAGSSGVEWPSAIHLFCSTDARHYLYVLDLVAHDVHRPTGPPAPGYATHTFEARGTAPTCQWIRLMVDAPGPYVFLDEIEVFGHSPSSFSSTAAPIRDTTDYFWRLHGAVRQQRAVRAALAEAERRLKRLSPASADAQSLAERITAVHRANDALSPDDWADAAPQYPMNAVHAAALALIGGLDSRLGAPAIAAWPANPWDPLAMWTTPEPLARGPLAVALMNGERRAVAVNVRNSTESDIAVQLRLEGPASVGSWAHIRRVAWTGDAEAQPVATAILPLDGSIEAMPLPVPAGVTVQAWITLAPRALPPGIYKGALTWSIAGGLKGQVPWSLRILSGTFPEHPTLHIGGWDYLDSFGSDLDNRQEVVKRIAHVLEDHGVDTPWATRAVLPFDLLRGTTISDPGAFARWASLWPHASRYRVFLAATGSPPAGIPGDLAYGNLWRHWAAHIQALGIPSSSVDLLLVDEPNTPALGVQQAAWAHALSETGAGFRIWSNPTYRALELVPEPLLHTSDTICFNRTLAAKQKGSYLSLSQQLHSEGRTAEIYSTAGPNSHLDPYAHHRLQAWAAFQFGAAGSSFWGFTDFGGGDPWREYRSPGLVYAPIFIKGTSVYPSKQLVAIREGQEDFEYLTALAAAIEGAARHTPPHPDVASARQLLADAVSRVLAQEAPYAPWSAKRERTAADESRLAIADMIERLQSVAGGTP